MARTRLILAAAALMVAMLVALSAPAMADDGHSQDGNGNYNSWNNWDNHNDFNHSNNDQFYFINSFNDGCEWEFEEGWFWGYWGLQWGAWFLDC